MLHDAPEPAMMAATSMTEAATAITTSPPEAAEGKPLKVSASSRRKSKGTGKPQFTKARVLATGRVGRVVKHDPSDGLLTYKLRFADGVLPRDDWFQEGSVACISESDKIDKKLHMEDECQFHEIGTQPPSPRGSMPTAAALGMERKKSLSFDADTSASESSSEGDGVRLGDWPSPFCELHVISSHPSTPKTDGTKAETHPFACLKLAATEALKRSFVARETREAFLLWRECVTFSSTAATPSPIVSG